MKNSKGEIDSESMAALENLLLQFPGGLNAIYDLSERRTALNSITKKLTDLEYSDVEVIDADYVNTSWDRVVESDVRYRFVIDVSTI